MSYLPVIIIKKKLSPTIISVGVEKSRKKGILKDLKGRFKAW